MAKCLIVSILVVSAVFLLLQNVHCRVIGGHRNAEEIFPLEGGDTILLQNDVEEYPIPMESEILSQREEDAYDQYRMKQQDRQLQNERHSDARSQIKEDLNIKHQVKPQDHSFQNEKHSVGYSQSTEDPSMQHQIKQQDPSFHNEKHSGTRSQNKGDPSMQHQVKQQDSSFQKEKHSDARSQNKGDPSMQHQVKQQDHSFQNEKHSDSRYRKERDPNMRSRRGETTDEHSLIGESTDEKVSNIEFGFNLEDWNPLPVELPLSFGFKAVATQGPVQQWGPPAQGWVPQFGSQPWNSQGWWPAYPGGQPQGGNPEQENTGRYEGTRELE